MKKMSLMMGLVLISMVLFASGKKDSDAPAMADVMEMSATLYTLSEEGLDEAVGTITVTDLSDDGIAITIVATDLVPGEHGFHLHEKNVLTPLTKEDGSMVIGGMAGGHWDPDNTGIHAGPDGDGHRGDLPIVTVAPDGTVDVTLNAKRIRFSDIKGKSFMIHAGMDNYSDIPLALGGGGARLYAAAF